MTWTGTARRGHSREGLRYPSDMTDREWAYVAPLLPPSRHGGRRRTTDLRRVMNAILYIASSGCQWRLRYVFADGGAVYPERLQGSRRAGDKLRTALKGQGNWTIDIIKRSDTAKGFEILPRRWVVERAFAWIGRCRRLAKDWEQSISSSTACAYIANVRILTRRLARYCWA